MGGLTLSEAESHHEDPTFLGGITPIFRVQDLQASIAYYVNVLGFKLNWGYPYFASVTRDRCGIFLCERDQGHSGAWIWIGVGDAEALHKEFLAKGAKVRHPPTNYQWAYEMQIEDLDGNVLRIGSEPKAGEPIGKWLDMDSNVWVRTPDGGWTKVERKNG